MSDTTPQTPTGDTPAQRPAWTALPAAAFTAKPRATQVVLFAAGDDLFGTPSLLADEDEYHLF